MNIITPLVIDNLQRTLARASAEHLRVSPRGGNSTQERFLPPADSDIALDMTALNHVVEYEPANLTITVEAGMTLAALQRTLGAHRQFLPLDPPLPERATLGGIIAANGHGPLRFRYGTARDWLIGVRVVLADGTSVKGGGRVVKNVAGYDMPKLFVGSHGTLGVVAEATFKLAPLPPVTRTLLAAADSARIAASIVPDLLRQTPLPHAVEVLDAAAAEGVLPAGGAPWQVAVQFAGTAAGVERQCRDFSATCAQKWLTLSAPVEAEAPFWDAIRDLPASLHSADAVTLELRALPSQIAETLEGMHAAAAEQGVACAAWARAGQAVWTVLRGEPAALAGLISAVQAEHSARGGYLVIQRMPEALHELVDLGGAPRADLAVMQRIKQQFDPLGILNPGVFAAGF